MAEGEEVFSVSIGEREKESQFVAGGAINQNFRSHRNKLLILGSRFRPFFANFSPRRKAKKYVLDRDR